MEEVMAGPVELPLRLKKASSPSPKTKASQCKPLKALKGGRFEVVGGAKSHGSKLSKFISPKHHIKKIRDAYVAFMIKLAGNKRMTLASSAGMSGGWPCAMQPLQFPGRQPRQDKLAEERECLKYAKKIEVPQLGPPPCARKAVFPI